MTTPPSVVAAEAERKHPRGAGSTCEHSFVTAQGSAYHRLRRALDRQNTLEALSAASELRQGGLVEALELCLLLLDHEPAKYGRAALRWHARFCREHHADLDEGQAILGCLAALRGAESRRAVLALAELVSRRGLERAGEALVAWSGR
jgi:hypothetical protein